MVCKSQFHKDILLYPARTILASLTYEAPKNVLAQLFSACSGFYNSLSNIRRHDGVVVEFHGGGTTAFGHGTKRSDVTKHFGERHFRPDHFEFSPIFHRLDLRASAGEITGNITHELLRHDHFHFHNRRSSWVI